MKLVLGLITLMFSTVTFANSGILSCVCGGSEESQFGAALSIMYKNQVTGEISTRAIGEFRGSNSQESINLCEEQKKQQESLKVCPPQPLAPKACSISAHKYGASISFQGDTYGFHTVRFQGKEAANDARLLLQKLRATGRCL